MSEPFGVTPAELRSVSSDLNDASSRMKGVMSSLRGQLAAEGAPWGGGSIGEAATGPLMIQGNHGPVAMRNIRVKPMKIDD